MYYVHVICRCDGCGREEGINAEIFESHSPGTPKGWKVVNGAEIPPDQIVLEGEVSPPPRYERARLLCQACLPK